MKAGGNVRVGAGVDVGIHAHRDACAHAAGLRRAVDPLELAGRFGVDGLQLEGTARSISSGVLPTPVKTMSDGENPARSARSISPIEFASTPLPTSHSRRTIASDEFAFIA